MKLQFPKRLAVSISIAVAVLSTAGAQAEPAPASYAGQQERTIKSLSDTDVAGLLAGRGAGLAKAAELNGYPGPAHVLELANDLELSDGQVSATRALMEQHRGEAARLGASLVDAERHLDSLFAKREATPGAVDQATARVGELQAQLRAEHLKTHITQTALLDARQIERYASLRGYDSTPAATAPRHSTHSH
jgi:hypothetical protein